MNHGVTRYSAEAQGLDRTAEPATESHLSSLAYRLEQISNATESVDKVLSGFRSSVLGEIDPPAPGAPANITVRPVESLVVRLRQVVDRLAVQIDDLQRQAQSIRQLG
jgi:hypothetical protein